MIAAIDGPFPDTDEASAPFSIKFVIILGVPHEFIFGQFLLRQSNKK